VPSKSITTLLADFGKIGTKRAIILYIEGVRDGRRFVEAARRITRHKPVVADALIAL
jgi:acetyltransferase